MTDTKSDEYWMSLALAEAQSAAESGEIPVGAIVVKDGVLIASGRNAPVDLKDPTAHAEIVALRRAAEVLGNYRLHECTLYVTLEPCAMCAGAILNARIRRLVFGAKEPKTGAAGSVVNLFQSSLNHQTTIASGILQESCSAAMRSFFSSRRSQRRQEIQSTQSYLREDALRTPEQRFSFLHLPESKYFNDLPCAEGLRLHFFEYGNSGMSRTWLCMHSLQGWSFEFLQLFEKASELDRILAFDLIGFGKSDKPKKENFHSLIRHQEIIFSFLKKAKVERFFLIVPESGLDAASSLLRMAEDLVLAVVLLPDFQDAGSSSEWRDAPYPNSGFKSGLKSLSKLLPEKKVFDLNGFLEERPIQRCLNIQSICFDEVYAKLFSLK